VAYLGWPTRRSRWTVTMLCIVTVVVVLHRCGGWGMEAEAVLLIVCGHRKVLPL
jgi:hypothetical protein